MYVNVSGALKYKQAFSYATKLHGFVNDLLVVSKKMKR